MTLHLLDWVLCFRKRFNEHKLVQFKYIYYLTLKILFTVFYLFNSGTTMRYVFTQHKHTQKIIIITRQEHIQGDLGSRPLSLPPYAEISSQRWTFFFGLYLILGGKLDVWTSKDVIFFGLTDIFSGNKNRKSRPSFFQISKHAPARCW